MAKNPSLKSPVDSQKLICYVRAKLIVCPWKARISPDIVLYGPGLTKDMVRGILKAALHEFNARHPHIFAVEPHR